MACVKSIKDSGIQGAAYHGPYSLDLTKKHGKWAAPHWMLWRLQAAWWRTWTEAYEEAYKDGEG
eukprot:1153133-Pelagomonas_calceolata.AAC.8